MSDTLFNDVCRALHDVVTKHERDLAEMRRQRDHAISVLAELHALVLGECPRLLDEDRGGDAKLDADIYSVLTPKEPRDG